MPTAMLERFQDHMPHVEHSAFVHTSAVVIGEVTVGAQSSIWPSVTLRGDDGAIVVGDRTSIQDGSVVHCTSGLSTTTIGNRVTVGHRVILHGCTVHDDCIIGMGAIVLDNAVIESGSIVGAGAVIPMGKVVKAGSVVIGNPFKLLRESTSKDAEWITHSWKEYVQRTEQYLAAREGSGPKAGA